MFWPTEKIKTLTSKFEPMLTRGSGLVQAGMAFSDNKGIRTIASMTGSQLPLYANELAQSVEERLKDAGPIKMLNYLPYQTREKIAKNIEPFASLILGKEGIKVVRTLLGIEEKKRNFDNLRKIIEMFIAAFSMTTKKLFTIINNVWQTIRDFIGTIKNTLFEYSPLKLLQIIDPGIFSPLLEPIVDKLKEMMLDYVKRMWNFLIEKSKLLFKKTLTLSTNLLKKITRKKDEKPESLFDHPLFGPIFKALAGVEGVLRFFGIEPNKKIMFIGGAIFLALKNSPFGKIIRETLSELLNPIKESIYKLGEKLGIETKFLKKILEGEEEEKNKFKKLALKFKGIKTISEKQLKHLEKQSKEEKKYSMLLSLISTAGSAISMFAGNLIPTSMIPHMFLGLPFAGKFLKVRERIRKGFSKILESRIVRVVSKVFKLPFKIPGILGFIIRILFTVVRVLVFAVLGLVFSKVGLVIGLILALAGSLGYMFRDRLKKILSHFSGLAEFINNKFESLKKLFNKLLIKLGIKKDPEEEKKKVIVSNQVLATTQTVGDFNTAINIQQQTQSQKATFKDNNIVPKYNYTVAQKFNINKQQALQAGTNVIKMTQITPDILDTNIQEEIERTLRMGSRYEPKKITSIEPNDTFINVITDMLREINYVPDVVKFSYDS